MIDITDIVKRVTDPTTNELCSYEVTKNNSNMVLLVPIDPTNSHYAEIMRQVADGTLTIQEAE